MKLPILTRLWKDPVWSKVISTLIVALILAAFAYFKGWWPNISKALYQSSLWTVAKTPISNWLLILLSLFALGFVLCIVAIVILRSGKAIPDFLSYQTDIFYEIRWRWTYVGGKIDRLVSFCPICDYQLIPKEAGAYAAAPRTLYECEDEDCRSFAKVIDLPQEEIENRILRSIQKKLRTQIDSTTQKQ
jgi:hypothetical protein